MMTLEQIESRLADSIKNGTPDDVNYWRGYRDATVICIESTVDAVEIVRCKDCKHWYGTHDDGMEHSCDIDAILRPGNHFCSYGEEKR